MSRLALRAAVALATLLAACKGPAVPSPLTNEVRYTCCNIHYEKPEISDVNYLKGTLIPFGTRVQILEVRRNSVKFQPAGHPPITLVLKYGDKQLTMDQYVDRIFLRDDPHMRLRGARDGGAPARAAARGKKGAAPREVRASEDGRFEKDIEQGVVEPGMTRDQVLMAIGYPPAHRTPSLEANPWTYWQNRWVTMDVYFDGDRVSRVQK